MHSAHPSEKGAPAGFPWPKIVLWTLLFQFAWSWRSVMPLLADGAMRDTDDLMRLSQVRNFLDGQGWYDLFNHRMDPPVGADIHWSRLVDVPLAMLVSIFDVFVETTLAERLAALVWPSVLIVATVLVLVAITRRFEPSINPLLVVLFSVMCVYAQLEFSPGRIDHHGLQILLVTIALLGLVSPARWWGPAIVGAMIALSLSIGLDAVAIIAFLFAWYLFDWIRGRDDGSRLRGVGIGLLATAPPLFVLNFPPSKWLSAACDANSAFYFLGLMLAGMLFVILASLTERLPHLRELPARLNAGRLAATAILGTIAAAALAAFNPQCLAGPLGALSPELVERWLSHVGEAATMLDHLAKKPSFWLAGVSYLVAATAASAFVTLRRHRAHPEMIPIFAVVLLTFCLAFFQIRVIRIGILATVPFVVVFATMAFEWIRTKLTLFPALRTVLQVAVVVFLAAPTWIVLGDLAFPQKPVAATQAPDAPPTWRDAEPGGLCNRQSEFALLAGLDRGLVMHDIDTGPGIVVFTAHDAIGGPYHRNQQAILAMLDFFETDAARARSIAAARGIDYVAFCEDVEVPDAEDLRSATLAARILSGREPGWLERVSPRSERLHVYRVRLDRD